MKRAISAAILVALSSTSTFAAQSNGSAALALAAMIAERSPTLSHTEKSVLAHFLAGESSFPLPPGLHHIRVSADKIQCRMGDVDISLHRCDLTFGATTISEPGAAGQALLATMQENGVASNGAAGTIYYTVSPVTCVVDPSEVESHDGGGAMCSYTNGP
jgi:hypothetical protein